MEVVGVVASVTGVIGFIGQIASGCNVVKNAIGDIKDAPKNILRISKHVDSVKAATDDVLQLHKRIKQCVGPDDILGDNVKDCFKAVRALEDEISTSVTIFKNAEANKSSVSSRRKSCRDFLHRLRYLTKKDDIEDLVIWLDRTKSQVVLVQQKLSIFQLKGHSMMTDFGTSVNETRSSQRIIEQKTTEILATVRDTSINIRSNPSIEAITTSMSTVVRGSLAPNVADLQAKTTQILERLDAQRGVEFSPMFQFGIANYIDQAVAMHMSGLPHAQHATYLVSGETSQVGNPSNVSLERRNEEEEPSGTLIASSRRVRTTRAVLSKTYKSFKILGILGYIQILTHKYTTNSTTSSQRVFESYRTTITLQARIPLLYREFRMTHESPSANFIQGCNTQLQVYGIHRWNSPYAIACRNSDIAKMQQMYNEGTASPLDHVAFNDLDFSFFNFPYKVMVMFNDFDIEKVRSQKMLRSLEFWLSIAPKPLPSSVSQPVWPVLDVDIKINGSYLKKEVLRLCLKSVFEDPLAMFDTPIYIETSGSLPNDDLEFLRVQGIYHLDESCHETSYFPGLFFESIVQILSKSDGLAMYEAVQHGLKYIPIEETNIFQSVRPLPTLYAILFIEFLNSTSKHFQGECNRSRLRDGCANRICLFIKDHFDLFPRQWIEVHYPLYIPNFPKGYYTILEFARIMGTSKTLYLALEKAHYDVREVLDTEKYQGIPELLSGESQYMTNKSVARHSWLRYAQGTYPSKEDGLDEDSVIELCVNLGISPSSWWKQERLEKATLEARKCIERKKKIPGSWVDDEDVKLVAGQDFEIPWCIQEGENYLRHQCIHYGTYHVFCEERTLTPEFLMESEV